MIFIELTQFKKDFKKLPVDIREKATIRLTVFTADQFDPLLNNHKLRHEYEGYRSINVTGDFRIVYRTGDRDICYLFRIGNHDQLFDL